MDCFTVILTDQQHVDLGYDRIRLHFIDAAIWATQHCVSFLHFDILDVSDCSFLCDLMAEYKFQDAQDASWFRLRWT